MNTTYQTLIVKFSEPITALDGIFDDTGAWGTDTLKGWIDDYESTRFTATDSHTAVITSEYNMEGGKRFTAMTGSRDFIDMGNGLRMSLARNKTSANRLDIIYDEGADLYNMRFYRRTFSKKTFECKTKDIAVHEGIYFDMLEEMFTMVTGLYTRF